MLTTSFPRHPGDFAGAFVFSLARELGRRGIDVNVVAPHDGHAARHQVHERFCVHRFAYAWPLGWQRLAYGEGIPNNLRRRPWVGLQIPGFLAMFLREAWRVCADCDIVHVHWAPLTWLGLVLRIRYRIPIVLTVHGTDVRSLPPFFTRPTLACADAIVTAAPETEAVLQKLGITNYHAIPLPIDEELLQPGMDPETVVEELGLCPKDDVVTFVGRLNEFKDPLTLIRAVPLVLAQRPQTRFVIVGDGPLANDVHALVTGLELEHAVHLMGARRDVGRFLTLSKLFVALSPVENAWSMAIAEAMYMRVPCIIARAGQTEQLFTHLQDAYLVEPGNEMQLAEAIIHLLSREEMRKPLIQSALALLQKHGKDSENIVQRMRALYQAVLDENTR